MVWYSMVRYIMEKDYKKNKKNVGVSGYKTIILQKPDETLKVTCKDEPRGIKTPPEGT